MLTTARLRRWREKRFSGLCGAELGMVHSPEDDFEHPLVPLGHPLSRHVFYRLSRP